MQNNKTILECTMHLIDEMFVLPGSTKPLPKPSNSKEPPRMKAPSSSGGSRQGTAPQMQRAQVAPGAVKAPQAVRAQ